MPFESVALIIIGDNEEELLKYSEKSCSLQAALSSSGYSLEKLLLPCTNLEYVRCKLEEALKCKDLVFTYGGFNVTSNYIYNVASQIYNEPKVYSEKLLQLLQNVKLNSEEFNVNVPKNSRVIPSADFPIIDLHRLFIVQEDLNLSTNYENLLIKLVKFRSQYKISKLYTFTSNFRIKDYMNTKLNNSLEILYEETHDVYKLKITSHKLKEINFFHNRLNEQKGTVIDVKVLDESNYEHLMMYGDDHVKFAINCITECFNRYGPENVFISFNGGKDCTVLLHLTMAVLQHSFRDFKRPLCCLYVKSERPFPQIDDFINDIRDYYNLDILTIKGGIKEALEFTLNQRSNLKACLMGTRRMDPFSQHLDHFQVTDSGWPSLMRVSPILDWDYATIWDYLLEFKVPYCSIYNDGYTSLGNVDNTVKNPHLLYRNEITGMDAYLPAYKLFDGTKERFGRL